MVSWDFSDISEFWFAAAGAFADVDSGKAEDAFGSGFFSGLSNRLWHVEGIADERQDLLLFGGTEPAVVADLLKALRKNVIEKTFNELFGRDLAGFEFIVI